VVHVDSERGFSGGEVQVLLLMEGLRARGVSQRLVSPRGSAIDGAARSRGFDTVAAPLKNDLDLRSVLRLSRAAADGALLHLHTGRATWLGGLAARWSGCPAVITRRMDRRVRRGLKTSLGYGRSDSAVVAISPSVREELLAAGVASDRVVVIPDALDPARIAPQRGRDAARAALDVAPEDVVVLALANFVHRKGLDVLLRAVARLADARVHLLLAGDGPEADSLQALSRQLGGPRAARFLGVREDVGDLLAACDVFCMPSRAEGMGVAALEALAAARPVVASRVGGLAHLVTDEQCGLLVPPGDDVALASALARLRDDPSLRARLGDAGPGRVDQGFRLEQYVDRHLEVYRSLLPRA